MRARITIVLTTLVVIGIAVASVLSYAATADQLRRTTDQFLVRRASELASGVRLPPEVMGGPPGKPARPAFEPDASIQFLDREGSAVAGIGGTLPVDAVDHRVAAGEEARVIRDLTLGGAEYRMITERYPQGAVQVARNVAGSREVLDRLALELALLDVALAVFTALLGWFLMKRSMAPLERLTAASERVANSASGAHPFGSAASNNTTSADLALIERDDAERGDEIGRLARSMDRMLASLAMSREQQRRLVQDAAHELRTPLTSLRANVEFLSYADRLDEADRSAILDALHQETDELSMLFDELVGLAIDPTAADSRAATTDLVALTEAVVDRFRRRTGRTIELLAPAYVPTASVVPSLVERAIGNLLGNAHKFSPPDTPIVIELSVGDATESSTNDSGRVDALLSNSQARGTNSVVWWHVLDEGPGIDEADSDRIFDRFYRSDIARSRQGSGLGLAIVRQVADQHGGSVSAASRPTGGAEVGFSVSAAPAPTSK